MHTLSVIGLKDSQGRNVLPNKSYEYPAITFNGFEDGYENDMKATLEFNLPEEGEDFYYAINAFNYYMALVEMDEWLRAEYKYNDKEEMYAVRQKLYLICSENNVTI